MDRTIALRILWINIFLISQGSFKRVNCSTTSIPAVELDALLQFKINNIAKGSQQLLQSWGNTSNYTVCQSWLGVSCTPSGHHIQGINLGGFGLEGSIAPDLANLTFLSTLNLSGNSFAGSIPIQLMGCTSLQVLDLSFNKLTAPIPSSLTSLPALQFLNLCYNNLSGSIPSAMFTNMSTSLSVVGLCNNALTGSIPPDIDLHNILHFLSMSQNHLTGFIPANLVNCTHLIQLELNNNLLTGTIPSFLSLPQLQLLNLCNNSLTGSLVISISTNISTSLLGLGLCNNALTGSIPADICLHLPNLQKLFMSENQFTGAYIPSNLGNCSYLTHLRLGSDRLIGPIPVELGLLHNLQVLELDQNNLTGAIPPNLRNCTNLITLALSRNQLTGPNPLEFGLVSDAITYILLSVNKLTGAIPPSIGNCTSLRYLDLGENQLSGVLPWELGLLGNFQMLLLSGSLLTGIIPSSIGNCTSLIDLDLSFNQLSGTIPSQFSMLGQLQNLFLRANRLSGPALQRLDFSNFTELQWLDMRSNKLSGSLTPVDFSKLQQIGALYLGGNYLTGEIPWGSLTNCTFLFDLDLSGNWLNGAIPGRLPALQFLYLENNLLSGEIPKSAEFNNLDLLEVDLSFNYLNGTLSSTLTHALSTLQSYLNFSHNDFSGSLPLWLGKLVEVTVIDLSNNHFTGSIPESLGDCAGLTALYLSNNHLSGDLPQQIGNLIYMDTLDLSYNNLSGVLPSFLGTRLPRLRMLNVSFNNFTGPIPTQEGVFRHLNASFFQGNPGLCGPVLNKKCASPLQMQHRAHHSLLQLKNWRWILLVTVISSLILTGLVLLILVALVRPCLSKRAASVSANSSLAVIKRYTAKELMEATQGYSEDSLLGQGGIGVVYKGVLSDGKIVAIKKIRDTYKSCHDALLQEMHILSKLRHRNLVQILGCVLNLDLKALVVEYMANGSLEHYLDRHDAEKIKASEQQKEVSSPRYWEMVSRVAMGIGHALAYVHHEYGESIIHGDVKPSNILLDSDLEPHLADFGIAKLVRRGADAVTLTSDFKGSIGYMAPEFAYAARITTKVDVFSYGVVLLRMLTGRSPTQVLPAGLSLHEWVKSKLASAEGGDLASWKELLDAALLQKMPSHNQHSQPAAAAQLLRMGLSCTAQNPEDRPTIHDVLAFLTSHKEILQS